MRHTVALHVLELASRIGGHLGYRLSDFSWKGRSYCNQVNCFTGYDDEGKVTDQRGNLIVCIPIGVHRKSTVSRQRVCQPLLSTGMWVTYTLIG